jgi:hypothetical protein
MHRTRQTTAGALAVLWLWAVLLSPMLHLVDHRADHVHGPHGTHAPSHRPDTARDHYGLGAILGELQSRASSPAGSAHDHPHPHGAHRHAADSGLDHRDPVAPPAPDEPPPDPDHGAGSAQHFSLSLALVDLCVEPAGLSGLSCRLTADRSVVSPASKPEPWLRRSRGPPRV